MPTFHNLNLRLTSPAALADWLASAPRPLWLPTGSTYHNTYRPDAASWRGHASMRSMQKTYEGYNWDRGPHIFIAVGTQDDGLFVMTPPWLEGIHAGACNIARFGLEVVGNFAQRPMSHAQLVALSETAAVLHDWARIGPDINAHRDCMPGRTCPGDAAYAQKADVQALLAFAQQTPTPTPAYTEHSPILGAPRANQTSVIAAIQLAHAERRKQRQRPQPKYPDVTSLMLIIGGYFDVCQPVGINTDLAIAQMLHETDWLCSDWCDRPRRNPAGIGVNGNKQRQAPDDPTGWALLPDGLWHEGLSFPNWYASVPAHVGRLVAYALAPEARSEAQAVLAAHALAYRPLPLDTQGSAPTLRPLGKVHNPSGRGWAQPGAVYGAKIATIANTLGGG